MTKKNVYRRAIKVLLILAIVLLLGFLVSIYFTIHNWPSKYRDKLSPTTRKNLRPSSNDISQSKITWKTLTSSTFFEFKEVPQNWRINFTTQFPSAPGYKFKPLYSSGVFTIPDICIESTPPSWPNITYNVFTKLPNGTSQKKTMSLPSKHLVGYNAQFNANVRIRVKTGANVSPNDQIWWITFIKDRIPSDREAITNHTAFFAIPTCEGNLHHFLQDSTFGLYGTMKATSRLNSSIPNQLFYRDPLWDLDRSDGCHNPARYEDILFALSIRKDHQTFHKVPHGRCYNHAVFGAYSDGFWAGEPEEYMVKKMGGDYSKCRHPYISIIQRKNRKILNINQVLHSAETIGLNHTHVLVFEEMTLFNQIKHIACTDILIGVHGAGLQWLRFLKPGKGLMEIAWPKKGWPYFYHDLANFARLEYEAVDASKNVYLNLTTYSNMVRHGAFISKEEQDALRKTGPKSSYDNHWKWADVEIDIETFKEKLKRLLQAVNKNKSL